MARRKVLVFSELFWPRGGGAELATHLIVKDLSKEFDVTIVSGTEEPAADVLKCCRYIAWPALKARPKPLAWLLAPLARRMIEGADVVYIPSHALLPLAIAARRVNPRAMVVVHLHNYQPLTYSSVLYPGLGGARADVATELLENKSVARAAAAGLIRWTNALSRAALDYADVVICVSKMQRRLLSAIPAVREKGIVVYNPPPPLPAVEGRPSKTPALVFPGGTSFGKGFNVVLEALPRILRAGASLYVIGGREVRWRYARPLGRASFVGRLEHGEYLRLVAESWGLLLPSIWFEPLPYSAVEALLMGVPVIMSSAVGALELVEGTPLAALAVRPGDPSDLADKVELLLANRPELLEAASTARGRIRAALQRSAEALKRIFSV